MDKTAQIIQIISNNIIQILAAVIFTAIITISIIAMFKNNKEDDRADYIKRFILILLAGFIILSAVSISSIINDIILDLSGAAAAKTEEHRSDNEIIFDKDLSFWERGLYSILNWFAESAVFVRNLLIGEDVNIRKTLENASSNPLVDFNVSYRGININLYNLILINAGFLLLLMVLRTAYKLLKMSYTPSLRDDVMNSFIKWLYVIISIIIVPAVFIALAEITDILISMLNQINVDLILNTEELTLESYGAFAPIAKIYASYLELKVWFLMLYRKLILNAFYLISPIALYLWGIGDEFEGSKYWLNTILMNMFTPFFYMLSFILGSIIAKNIPNGNNALVIAIISGLTLKIGDELKKVVQIKSLMSAGASERDANNMARGIFSTIMVANTARNLSRSINSSKLTGTSNKSNYTKTSSRNDIKQSMQNIKNNSPVINKGADILGKGKEYEFNNISKVAKGADAGKNIGNIIGKALNSQHAKKSVSTAVGIAVGVSTSNPVLGAAAYKGTKKAADLTGSIFEKTVPTAGKITGAVLTVGKDNIETAGRAVNYYLKGNSDIKAYGRR